MKHTFALSFIICALCTSCSYAGTSDAQSADGTTTAGTTAVPDSALLCGDSVFVSKVAAVMAAATVQTGGGLVYYIAPASGGGSDGSVAGSDNAAGTADVPWATFAHALPLLAAGDTLYVKGGTYTQTMSGALTGTADGYITIAAAPGESPVIDGQGNTVCLCNITGSSYIQICNITFKNTGGYKASQSSCGVYYGGATNHVIISGCTFSGITVASPATSDHCANCILLFGDGTTETSSVNNVLVYNNTLTNCATGWAECISAEGNVSSMNVIANTLDTTGNIGIDFSGNYGYCTTASLDFVRSGLIYGNSVNKCISSYGDTSYGIYVDGGQHIVIQANTVTNSMGGIEAGAEQNPSSESYCTAYITITGNTLTGNTSNGISIGGYKTSLGWVKSVVVSNNTCRNNGNSSDGAQLTLSKCSGVSISGNVLCNSGGGAIVYSAFSASYTADVSFSGNYFWNGSADGSTSFWWTGKEYSSFSAWKSACNSPYAGTYGQK